MGKDILGYILVVWMAVALCLMITAMRVADDDHERKERVIGRYLIGAFMILVALILTPFMLLLTK